jgi:hypothetical protein
MINNIKIPIWLYWENKDKSSDDPDMIKRCKEIFGTYDNVILLNENTIHDYLVDLVDCQRIQHIAQKADYYRAKLLYEYGGIWIDIDMILLQDITYIYRNLLNSDFELCCEYGKEQKICNISCLMFKPKSIIAEKWYKYCEEYILSNLPIEWASLGGVALGKIIHDGNYVDKIMYFPAPFIFSLGYENKKYEQYYSVDEVFINEKIDWIITNKPKIIMLYGTFMYKLPIGENCLLDKMFKLINEIYLDLDFLEIGTSNFSTLIETCDDDAVGMSIEPVKYYLYRLPNKKNVRKFNAAITGDRVSNAKINIFYIPEDVIIKENLDFFFKGCNKIGDYHPLHLRHGVTHLVKTEEVDLINIGEFLRKNKVRKIKFLQTDTEGHDINIMNGLYDYISNLSIDYHPNEIKFETNQYSTKAEIDDVLNLYDKIGYVLVSRNDDGDTIIRKV